MARSRSLPEAETLDRALRLFWRQGYDRTSINDLSAAIGVGPSSLYNAFGSKATLFRRSLDRYMETHAASVLTILATPEAVSTTARDVEERIRGMLRTAVGVYKSDKQPLGCALLQGGGAGVPEDSVACAITMELKTRLEDQLRAVFETAEPELLPASPQIFAKYVLGTMRGLSQLACDGASREDLLAVADLAAGTCAKGDSSDPD